MTRFAFEALHLEAQRAIAAEGLRPFTRRTGLPMGVVRSLAENRDLSVSNVLAVAEALDFEVFAQPKRFRAGFSEPQRDADFSAFTPLRSGFLPIPWHEDMGFKGSAPFAFSGEWMEAEGLVPDTLKAITPQSLTGDASSPKQIVALIDTAAQQTGGASKWGFREGKSVTICRAAFHEDLVVLIPSNESEPVRTISRRTRPDFKVLGRVVWIGRRTP